MRVVFVSNFLNHHQLPFCLEMVRRLGNDFRFIATEPIHAERLAMKYEDMNDKYSFCIKAYEEGSYALSMQLCESSDIVIIGSAPEEFIKNRLIKNKLTFRYSERIFKRGIWRIVSPRALYNLYKNHTKYRDRNLYMLCASAYTASDFSLVGAYRNKTFKWGYFPEVKKYDINELLLKKRNNSKISILWVGRLLRWKHPELAIEVAKMLRNCGYDFEMNIIGQGPMEKEIKSLIKINKLDDYVKMFGFMQPEKVREQMEKANIFLFTSDYNEGWGAVLNEAMNSGCAVVASHAIGSVPFLIKHNKNGLIYKNQSIHDLFIKVETLISDSNLCETLGNNAYQTISYQWSAENAANQLINLCHALMNRQDIEIQSGPCSRAKIIHQHKMYQFLLN